MTSADRFPGAARFGQAVARLMVAANGAVESWDRDRVAHLAGQLLDAAEHLRLDPVYDDDLPVIVAADALARAAVLVAIFDMPGDRDVWSTARDAVTTTGLFVRVFGSDPTRL